ncbi:Chromosome partition protein Smc [Carpediemonas membranifera]|uniref:Chromosome partition protein Smc n=1 Tax=Carpediemonas membranifera TaxID=201153 RepID=A0A8J6ASL4_9EUKA|nr:Chromosome partition protein Smc [Carpediemonas membranifera]|eukprot:KAG9393028.1 Chromosome partition protein Smc [Carpediemonas membranifera]
MSFPSHVVSLEATYNRRIRELSDINYKLSTSNETLERRLTELNSKHQRLIAHSDRIEKMLHMAELQQGQNLTQTQRYVDQIRKQSDQILQLESSVHNMSTASFNDASLNSTRRSTVLQSENHMLSSELDQSRAAYDGLADRVRALTAGLEKKADELRLGENGAELLEQIGVMEVQIKDLKADLVDREKEIRTLEEEKERLSTENSKMAEKMDNFRTTGDDFARSTRIFESESSRLQTRVGELQSERNALHEILKERACEEQAMTEAKTELDAANTTIIQMENTVAIMRSQFEQAQSRVGSLTAEVESESKSRRELQQEVSQLKAELKAVTSEDGKKMRLITQMESVQDELLEALTESQGQVDLLQSESKKLELRVSRAEKEAMDAKKELRGAEESYSQQRAVMAKSRDALIAEQESVESFLRKEVSTVEGRLEAEVRRRQQIERDFEEFKTQAEKKQAALEREVETLTASKSSNAENSELALTALRSQLELAETKIVELTEKAEGLQAAKIALASAQLKVKVLTEDKDVLKESVAFEREAHESHVSALVEELASLRSSRRGIQGRHAVLDAMSRAGVGSDRAGESERPFPLE